MRGRLFLVLTLAAVAALTVACGGSSAAQPATSASPAVTPQSVVATAAPGAAPTTAAQPYPVVTAAPVQPTAKPAAGATVPPAAPYPVVKDGLTLMNERCTGCHDLARIQSLKQNRAGWEATVAKQKAKGATLTDAETTILVDFLAATYK